MSAWKKCHLVVAAACLVLLVMSPVCYAKDMLLKVNLGGETTDGFSSEEEVVDFSQIENVSKMRFHGEINNGKDFPNVFKTQRFSRHEDLVLKFPIEDGIYKVSLLFAETWDGAYNVGKRVFDVCLYVIFIITFSLFFPLPCSHILFIPPHDRVTNFLLFVHYRFVGVFRVGTKWNR